MENYETNMSPTFNKNLDINPWIGGQQCFEMSVWYFSNNPDSGGYVGKLPEQHFNERMLSNPRDNILILYEILWSQDLSNE